MPNLQFTSSNTGTSPSSLTYSIAGVSGAPIPPAVYVSETSAFTYDNVTGALTVSGLQNSTSYVFTITAAGYDSVTTATNTTGSVQQIRNEPPTLASSPANQTRAAGATTFFAVSAGGSSTSQWYKNGVAIDGVTGRTYTTTTAADGDTFYVTLTNADGTTTSGTATFTLATAPAITVQPQGVSSAAGGAIVLSVTATGTAPLTYQWQLNGTNITGATSSSLATTAGSNGDSYRVIISNFGGSVTSEPAVLTVTGGGDPICFLADAPILTPSGYRRIADLRVGDMVRTADGRRVPIRTVKIMTCAAGERTCPYIIPRGQFGAKEELLISPRHRVAVGDRMVEARDLGLKQAKMEGIITYYNLGLPEWQRDNMIVAGVAVESLAPVVKRTISMADFTRLIALKHGGRLTAAKMADIMRACRLLPDGRVEVPYVARS